MELFMNAYYFGPNKTGFLLYLVHLLATMAIGWYEKIDFVL